MKKLFLFFLMASYVQNFIIASSVSEVQVLQRIASAENLASSQEVVSISTEVHDFQRIVSDDLFFQEVDSEDALVDLDVEALRLQLCPIAYMYNGIKCIQHDEKLLVGQFLRERPVYYETLRRFQQTDISSQECRCVILRTMYVLGYPVQEDWLKRDQVKI